MEYRASSLRLLAMAALASNRDEGGALGPLGEHQLSEDSRETNSDHTGEHGISGLSFFLLSFSFKSYFLLSSPVIIFFRFLFWLCFLFFSFFSLSLSLSGYCRCTPYLSIVSTPRVTILIRLFPASSSDNRMTYIFS